MSNILDANTYVYEYGDIPAPFRMDVDKKGLKRLTRNAQSVMVYCPWLDTSLAVQKASVLAYADTLRDGDAVKVVFTGIELTVLALVEGPA